MLGSGSGKQLWFGRARAPPLPQSLCARRISCCLSLSLSLSLSCWRCYRRSRSSCSAPQLLRLRLPQLLALLPPQLTPQDGWKSAQDEPSRRRMNHSGRAPEPPSGNGHGARRLWKKFQQVRPPRA
jgi:hypothetical protein